MIFGLTHRNIGRVTPTNFVGVMFRMKYWAHVRSAEYIFAAPIPWDELKHLVEIFSGRSWPKIGPGIILFGVFETFETFFSKICAHSERYRNLLAGIFEIPTIYANITFPLSPVSQLSFLDFLINCWVRFIEILLGWKTYKYYYETHELPNPRKNG